MVIDKLEEGVCHITSTIDVTFLPLQDKKTQVAEDDFNHEGRADQTQIRTWKTFTKAPMHLEEFANPESEGFIYKSTKIAVAIGDLIIEDTDAIVSPAIGMLKNDHGLAKKISDAGGELMVKDCMAEMKARGDCTSYKPYSSQVPNLFMPPSSVLHRRGTCLQQREFSMRSCYACRRSEGMRRR